MSGERRLDGRHAGVVVAEERILDCGVARRQRLLDSFRKALDLGRQFFAGGEANGGLGLRGAAGCGDARGDDGECRAADQEKKACGQQAGLKQGQRHERKPLRTPERAFYRIPVFRVQQRPGVAKIYFVSAQYGLTASGID